MARSATRKRSSAARRRRRGSTRRRRAPAARAAATSTATARATRPPVTRPFEGLPGEADWVALRELVPAATAKLRTTDGRDVTLASVLPGGTPALVRANGEIMLGVQLQASSDDVSRDLGTALAAALEAPAGAPVDPGPIGGAGSAGPRLQELLDLAAPLEVTVHDDFGFWLEGADPGAAALAGLRARQRGDPADRPAGGAGGRLLGAAERRAGAPALGAARARGEAARRAGPAVGGGADPAGRGHPLRRCVPGARPRRPRVGPARRHRRPRTGPGRRPSSRSGWSRRSPSTEPLTADERRARAGLLSRQITLR